MGLQIDPVRERIYIATSQQSLQIKNQKWKKSKKKMKKSAAVNCWLNTPHANYALVCKSPRKTPAKSQLVKHLLWNKKPSGDNQGLSQLTAATAALLKVNLISPFTLWPVGSNSNVNVTTSSCVC